MVSELCSLRETRGRWPSRSATCTSDASQPRDGYDPEWARHHVGIFLHSDIVIDLAASGGAVTEFDFGNGDNLHKERLSTGSRREGYD